MVALSSQFYLACVIDLNAVAAPQPPAMDPQAPATEPQGPRSKIVKGPASKREERLSNIGSDLMNVQARDWSLASVFPTPTREGIAIRKDVLPGLDLS